MKKRLITGAILLAVLIPLITIESLLPVFQIVAGLFVLVGTWEMIRLFVSALEKMYFTPLNTPD